MTPYISTDSENFKEACDIEFKHLGVSLKCQFYIVEPGKYEYIDDLPQELHEGNFAKGRASRKKHANKWNYMIPLMWGGFLILTTLFIRLLFPNKSGEVELRSEKTAMTVSCCLKWLAYVMGGGSTLMMIIYSAVRPGDYDSRKFLLLTCIMQMMGCLVYVPSIPIDYKICSYQVPVLYLLILNLFTHPIRDFFMHRKRSAQVPTGSGKSNKSKQTIKKDDWKAKQAQEDAAMYM
jgi:hypothetical protein